MLGNHGEDAVLGAVGFGVDLLNVRVIRFVMLASRRGLCRQRVDGARSHALHKHAHAHVHAPSINRRM